MRSIATTSAWRGRLGRLCNTRRTLSVLFLCIAPVAVACVQQGSESESKEGAQEAAGDGSVAVAGAAGTASEPVAGIAGTTGGTSVVPPSAGATSSTAGTAGSATAGTNSLPVGGSAGDPPVGGTDGQLPVGGMDGDAGQSPPAGTGGANTDPPPEPGSCCPDGDCICRNPDPASATFSLTGPFQTQMYAGETGNIYYPVGAEPPYAGVALCGGYTNTGLEMQAWGTFYASWGIVTLITWTGGSDQPSTRGRKLLASIDELEAENENPMSPIYDQMSDRYGISGYSMGGGGTTTGCRDRPSLKTGVGLAPWQPVTGMRVPTLFLVGDADFVAGAESPRTASGTPSLQVVFSLYTHFNWFGPDNVTGHYALAWQKMYLEGDTRWEAWLQKQLTGVASLKSN